MLPITDETSLVAGDCLKYWQTVYLVTAVEGVMVRIKNLTVSPSIPQVMHRSSANACQLVFPKYALGTMILTTYGRTFRVSSIEFQHGLLTYNGILESLIASRWCS